MAVVRVCDICGSPIVPTDLLHNATTICSVRLRKIFFPANWRNDLKKQGSYGKSIRLDMCEKCFDDFQDFAIKRRNERND